MKVTRRSLERFKRLYWENFGLELSDAEAERKAEYLLEIFRIVYGAPNLPEFFDNKTQDEESE